MSGTIGRNSCSWLNQGQTKEETDGLAEVAQGEKRMEMETKALRHFAIWYFYKTFNRLLIVLFRKFPVFCFSLAIDSRSFDSIAFHTCKECAELRGPKLQQLFKQIGTFIQSNGRDWQK